MCHNHYKSTVVLPALRVNAGPQQEGLPRGSSSVSAEKLSTLLLQLKNSPSINDECQTQHDVWPGKHTRILCRFMVTAGQETTGQGWHGGDTERGDKRMLGGACCKCHFVLFNASQNVAMDI